MWSGPASGRSDLRRCAGRGGERDPGFPALGLSLGLYGSTAAVGAVMRPLAGVPVEVTRVALLPTVSHNLLIVAILALGGFALAVPTLVVGAVNGVHFGMILSAPSAPRHLAGAAAHGSLEFAGQLVAATVGFELAAIVAGCLTGWSIRSRPSRSALRALVAVALTVAAGVVEWGVSPGNATGTLTLP